MPVADYTKSNIQCQTCLGHLIYLLYSMDIFFVFPSYRDITEHTMKTTINNVFKWLVGGTRYRHALRFVDRRRKL
ncbi:hypothetical protein BDV29DRAFT_179093, partial [Aspergillus leporis]